MVATHSTSASSSQAYMFCGSRQEDHGFLQSSNPDKVSDFACLGFWVWGSLVSGLGFRVLGLSGLRFRILKANLRAKVRDVLWLALTRPTICKVPAVRAALHLGGYSSHDHDCSAASSDNDATTG